MEEIAICERRGGFVLLGQRPFLRHNAWPRERIAEVCAP